MLTAILIDATKRDVEPLEISTRAFIADLERAIGSDGIELGARLPDGGRIYLDPLALHTSRDYFHHCLVGSPLPGRGVLVAERDLSPDLIRPFIEFMSRDEVFPRGRAFDTWMREVALNVPGVSLFCEGQSWRL